MKTRKIVYLALGLVLLLNTSVVSAAEFRTADDGGNVTVGAEEVVKNLYIAGNLVSINGEVQKDLYVAGNVVTIANNVENNVMVGGSTVLIKGNVGGNVHVGGSSIVVEGNVGEDLFLAGGNIIISRSSTIGGDLYVGSGTLDIEGTVAGKVFIGGGQVTINGKIDGPIMVEAEELKIGKSAELALGLKYTSPNQAEIDTEAKILGPIDFNQKAVGSKSAAAKTLFGILSMLFLMKLIIFIVTGLVLIYIFKGIAKATVKESLGNFWRSLGIGFAALFLTPILAIILAITVVGSFLAGLLFLTYILLILLACLLATFSLGSWLMKLIRKKGEYLIGWQEVIVGVIVSTILVIIPVLGGLVYFVFMLISLGALYSLIFKSAIRKS